MTTSAFALNSVDIKDRKKASRTKAMILAAFVSLTGLGIMLAEPASACSGHTTIYSPYRANMGLNL